MKKYEYLSKTYYTRDFDLVSTLNDLGQYGWQVVSLYPVMFLDNPNIVNRYEVVIMKEI